MWHALIISLILSSADLADVGAAAPPEAWQAMKDTAGALELYSPSGNWGVDFGSELRWCQRWAVSLKNAPPLADHHWLPSQEIIKTAIAFNEQHRAWLEMRAAARPWCVGTEHALEQTRRLGLAWTSARDAINEGGQWNERRVSLARLRELIGERAYYAGEMPPWVPVGWFAAIRE